MLSRSAISGEVTVTVTPRLETPYGTGPCAVPRSINSLRVDHVPTAPGEQFVDLGRDQRMGGRKRIAGEKIQHRHAVRRVRDEREDARCYRRSTQLAQRDGRIRQQIESIDDHAAADRRQRGIDGQRQQRQAGAPRRRTLVKIGSEREDRNRDVAGKLLEKSLTHSVIDQRFARLRFSQASQKFENLLSVSKTELE